MIAEVLIGKGEADLITQYALENFSINVLSVRRTLVEKMLGVIKDSYSDDPLEKLSDRIRHLYDICQILKHDEYRNFVTGVDFKSLCELCIEDEKTGFFEQSDCLEYPLVDAPIFSEFGNWRTSLGATYTGAFSNLVYGELPTMNEIEEAFDFIKGNLK